MIRVKGQEEFRRLMANLPERLEQTVLRGGLREGAKVLAQEAKTSCRDDEVAADIGVFSKAEPGMVTATVRLRGDGPHAQWLASKARWLEYGTAAHVIRVRFDEAGRTARRINTLAREGSLVIGGNFVGDVVMHKGARPYPFMRTALDRKLGEALAAMAGFIQGQLDRYGLNPPAITFEAVEE